MTCQGTMKKYILIASMLFVGVFAMPARAEPAPLTLLIAGNGQNNAFHVSLSPDGREYLIVSTVELETGGDICSHPEEIPNELACEATAIAGFEVNGLGGADTVIFSSDIPAPVTIRGGGGRDRLMGGTAADKLLGGPDDDLLIGRRGDDWIVGGPGNDRLLGGQGNDQLRGGPGEDKLVGGPGQNTLLP
jgi:Ca2+-binding RTX toxin-like protein